jgi:putative ABC transport system permease protein
VVGDIRQVNLDRSASPELYYPIAQNYSELLDLGMTLVVRGEGRPDNLIQPIRGVIRRVSPNQAIFNVKTMIQVVADSVADFTLYLWLMNGFAVLALSLAAIGAYGVMAYITAARRREFAVRAALGASTVQLARLVFREGARLTVAGVLLGVAGALAATPLLRAFPISVRPPDAEILLGVAVLVGGAAMAACLLPALRAAGADPMHALRED